jgi:hypothetical protein
MHTMYQHGVKNTSSSTLVTVVDSGSACALLVIRKTIKASLLAKRLHQLNNILAIYIHYHNHLIGHNLIYYTAVISLVAHVIMSTCPEQVSHYTDSAGCIYDKVDLDEDVEMYKRDIECRCDCTSLFLNILDRRNLMA